MTALPSSTGCEREVVDDACLQLNVEFSELVKE